MALTPAEISRIRLNCQHIAGTKYTTAKDVVGWMGALQAQDYAMSKWAAGVRLPDSTEKSIEQAINSAEIIRTHALRPTWHLVSADDIYWMLELTAPHIKASMRARDKELELTAAVLSKTNSLLEKILSGGRHATREEILAVFTKAKIGTSNNRASHILLNAELEGIVCSGAVQGKKNTYALLSERVPKKKMLSRDEALALLAKKYFSSHGPASVQDFLWWSNLPVADGRRALEMVKSQFISETIGSETYWFSDASLGHDEDRASMFLLPAFDEFLISYKNRHASLHVKHHPKAFSSNGIFWPVVVADGQVIGVWKRVFRKNTVVIETALFQRLSRPAKKLIENKAHTFGQFLDKHTEVHVL